MAKARGCIMLLQQKEKKKGVLLRGALSNSDPVSPSPAAEQSTNLGRKGIRPWPFAEEACNAAAEEP